MTPRTYLFVPGDRPERFDKALASGADAVVLDLEDAVAPAAKAGARAHVARRLQSANPEERSRLVVRINDEASEHFAADLALLAAAAAESVMLPKAERTETIARFVALREGLGVIALIESARGVLAAPAIAAAPSVQRLAFGTIDFALDLGLSGDPAGFDAPASALAVASRAAGIAAPIAGVTTALDDPAQLIADLARARAHGYTAKLCIHPAQIAAVHAAFAPQPAELDWARRVVEAAATATGGALRVDGRMVDKPVLLHAQAVLARAAR